VGEPATLVLVDPAARRTVAPEGFSRSRNNPYVGLDLPGAVVLTLLRGRATFATVGEAVA
jgi:dihydroorotase